MLFLRSVDSLPQNLREAVRQKVWNAESNIAWMRLAVVIFNSIVWFFLPDHLKSSPELAWLIIFAAALYSGLYLILKPYRRYPVFMASYFTTVSDAALIALWIYVTGNYGSPFYLLWIVSIIAVAYRYLMVETVAAAIIYILCYGFILAQDPGHIDKADVVIRFGYILLAGITAALISGNALHNLRDKIGLQESEEKFRNLNRELESRIKERTAELEKANKRMAGEIELRKSIESKQDSILRELKNSNEELNSFAYVVSHDLKAPLRGISTLCQWIVTDMDGECSPDMMEKLRMMQDRVDKLRNLIDGILRLSRSGRGEQHKTAVDPCEVIREINSVLDGKSKMILVREPMPGIWYDRTAFFQVMENLISNAIKYGGGAGKPIIISGWKENNIAHFSVKDQGKGIEESRQKDIFRMFRTGADKDEESTGIGLAIVKRIVERNGGKIWVQSKPDQGSEFVFTIPLPKVSEHRQGEHSFGDRAV